MRNFEVQSSKFEVSVLARSPSRIWPALARDERRRVSAPACGCDANEGQTPIDLTRDVCRAANAVRVEAYAADRQRNEDQNELSNNLEDHGGDDKRKFGSASRPPMTA
jgi:hypothetical protein